MRLYRYGMTENACGASMTKISDIELSESHAYESIGQPLPFLEAKVIDTNTGEIVPHNTVGELCFRGFSVMRE